MTPEKSLAALFIAAAWLPAACAPAPENRLASYRTPDVPPECRAAVYQDPKVRQLVAAGTAVPTYMANNQNNLAFAEAEAERNCMREKGLLPQGGVEPTRYTWYPPLF
jgi:hypothetical protein